MTDKKKLTIARAKQLRLNMTKPEDRLWWYLTQQKLIYGKFRRQEPVDHYIADFLSYEHRLIIELDGSNHIPEEDAARDNYLISQGFRVLRFTNQDVTQNIKMVLDNIYHHITPSPKSLCDFDPPARGG